MPKPTIHTIPVDFPGSVREFLARRDALVAGCDLQIRQMAAIVKRHTPPSIEIDDLRQAGYIAALRAAERFREQGVKFWTFAARHVRGAMIDQLRRKNAAFAACVPIDGIVDPGFEPSTHAAIERKETIARVRAALRNLTPNERGVIEDRYSDREPTMQQTAERLKVNTSRISQLHTSAVGKIRRALDGAA